MDASAIKSQVRNLQYRKEKKQMWGLHYKYITNCVLSLRINFVHYGYGTEYSSLAPNVTYLLIQTLLYEIL